MYKTIQKMLLETRDELIEEIARNRKIETEDLRNEIGDLYDSADNERDRQLSHILTDRDRKKLIEIDEALERIEDKRIRFTVMIKLVQLRRMQRYGRDM